MVALKIPKVRAALVKAGYEPDDRSPDELASFIREEASKYREAVQAAKLEPE